MDKKIEDKQGVRRESYMKERGITMKTIRKTTKKVLCVFGGISFVMLCLIGVYKLGAFNAAMGNTDNAEDDPFGDIYTDDVDVTIYDVEHKLGELGELAVAVDNYEGRGKVEDAKYVDLPIVGETEVIGTDHSVDISYSGVVKAGYELAEVKTNIDKENREIEITLPEAKILDNYIDTYTPEETKKSLINPVRPEEISAYLENVAKPDGLKKAEERGIYDIAEESVKKQIESQLSCFTRYGYNVLFVIAEEKS